MGNNECWDINLTSGVCIGVVCAEARESVRQSSHRSLREAIVSGDLSAAKLVISQLAHDALSVVTIQPHGANTLLYLSVHLSTPYLQLIRSLTSAVQYQLHLIIERRN